MNRELACKNERCGRYVPVASITAPEGSGDCRECGEPLESVLYAIATVFTGVISERYKDRSKEGGFGDGHWSFPRDPETKKVTPRFIETFDDQRRMCSEFGLANPKEFGNNYEVSEDGKSVKNSIGMPGCEI